MASSTALDTSSPIPEGADPSRPGGLRLPRPHPGDLLVLAGFVALTMLLFRDAWRSPTTTWVGGPGDPPFFMWQLRWLPHAIAEGQNPLFTTSVNYPDGVNLMWNTTVLLPALILAPVTVLLGPLLAYNVLITAAVALSGWCAYLMLRHYVTSPAAALAGALLYGFSPYVYSHAHDHPNLAAAFVPPLLFLLLEETLVRQKRPPVHDGLLLGGLATAQFLVSEEVLATQTLVCAVGLALLVLLHARAVRPRVRHAATALAVAASSALVACATPLLFQFFGPRRVSGGALWGPDIFTTDLVGLVVPRGGLRFNPTWTTDVTKHFTDACCGSEWSAYLGVPLLVLLVVITARLWSSPLVRLAGLLAAAVTVLSMGPHLHVGGTVTPMALPFARLSELPVITNMLAERLMLYVYLMAALLVALAVDHLLRAPRRPVLAAAVALVALVPLTPNLAFASTRASSPPFFRSADVRRIEKDSVVLVAPFARDTSTSGPMLWQADADMRYRMPSGYILGPDGSGRFTYLPLPTPLSVTMERIQRGENPPTLDLATRGVLVADLIRGDIRAAVVGPMQNQEAMVAFLTDLLRRSPSPVGGVWLWTDVDPPGLF